MTETDIKTQLDKTYCFADRQKLLKKLWKMECAAASKRQQRQPISATEPRTTQA